jgi:hypothetical protein
VEAGEAAMKTRLARIVIGIATIASAPALASELYSNDYSGAATLYRMDQSAGTANPVGPVNKDNIGDLTSDTREATATLWGVRIGGVDRPGELVTIDPVTGAETDSVTISINTTATNQPGYMTSIAFDPVSGVLYGNTSVGFGAAFDALYEIDPVTGVADFIGRITFENVYSLGFSQGGKLYGIADATDELIGISVLSGNGTFIADVDLSLSFDIASRPEDDAMFLVDSATSSLYTLDVGDGSVTSVGPYGGNPNLVGLAFSPIPEPGTLLLIAFGLPLLAMRRRGRS